MGSPGGIVITGASTGIGRAAALALAERGFRVFAGVRNDAVAEELTALHARITPLALDVTRQDQIAAAVETVRESLGGAPLAGLMNNAGVFSASPLEYAALDDLRQTLEVNVLGILTVSQAFLPMLREAQGRIVITGSISGILTTPMVGGYCLSKAAAESLADSLRLELRQAEIEVSLLQVGAVETPLWNKGESQTSAFLDQAPAEVHQRYGLLMDQVLAMTADHHSKAVSAEQVARTVVRAFTARRPKPRYVVGGNTLPQVFLAALPTRWRDAILRALLRRFGRSGN